MYGDVRDDWKIRDIESKVNQVGQRMYELDALRGDVSRLERDNKELSSLVNGLRYELEALSERTRQIEDNNEGE